MNRHPVKNNALSNVNEILKFVNGTFTFGIPSYIVNHTFATKGTCTTGALLEPSGAHIIMND
jgi:hypothetical protein